MTRVQQFVLIKYEKLNSPQRENYNFHKTGATSDSGAMSEMCCCVPHEAA